MKLLSCIFYLLLFTSSMAQTQMDTLNITYEARTRGSSIVLKANATLISYKDNSTSKEITPTEEFWNDITTLLEKIKLSKIENLSPPSHKKNVDAALHATLSVTSGSKTYRSQTFDHGNPPKELKALIEKLFSEINQE